MSGMPKVLRNVFWETSVSHLMYLTDMNYSDLMFALTNVKRIF